MKNKKTSKAFITFRSWPKVNNLKGIFLFFEKILLRKKYIPTKSIKDLSQLNIKCKQKTKTDFRFHRYKVKPLKNNLA